MRSVSVYLGDYTTLAEYLSEDGAVSYRTVPNLETIFVCVEDICDDHRLCDGHRFQKRRKCEASLAAPKAIVNGRTVGGSRGRRGFSGGHGMPYVGTFRLHSTHLTPIIRPLVAPTPVESYCISTVISKRIFQLQIAIDYSPQTVGSFRGSSSGRAHQHGNRITFLQLDTVYPGRLAYSPCLPRFEEDLTKDSRE